MKRLVILVVLLAVVCGGCSGVWMNAEYSTLLDKTAALSAQTAETAEAGQMTPEQMTLALRKQADVWAMFRNARDGKK